MRRMLSIAGASAALAALGYAFVMTASAMSCGEHTPEPAVDAAVEASPPRAHAAPLVVRGIIEPKNPDDLAFSCLEVMGGRRGTESVYLAPNGAPREIHVFAKARGPLGVRAGDRCAVAKAN